MDFSSSPTWPELVKEFRYGREIHFPEHTHFLPMEIPDRVAELILRVTPHEEGPSRLLGRRSRGSALPSPGSRRETTR
jgi:hypothetical protein